jgi:hypothetical protein
VICLVALADQMVHDPTPTGHLRPATHDMLTDRTILVFPDGPISLKFHIFSQPQDP